jgi:CCR4-NOT transcription complex subunit 1
LAQYRASASVQDKEIYACIVTGLLDEFRYHDLYPVGELIVTGDVFGHIVHRELVEGKTLEIAVDIVRQSLRKQHIKQIAFALRAVQHMHEKVADFPALVEDVFKIAPANLDGAQAAQLEALY